MQVVAQLSIRQGAYAGAAAAFTTHQKICASLRTKHTLQALQKKKYRVSMFLPTPFKEDRAMAFLHTKHCCGVEGGS
jgi:hypothetical protein